MDRPGPPRSPERPHSAADVVAVVTAMIVTGAFALHGAGHHSLWADEGVTAHAATGNTTTLLEWMGNEPNFALYDLTIRAVSWIGETERVLRFPSALFAVATVPVLYAIARRLFDRTTAMVAVALYSVNGFLLSYAQELRPYTLVVFTSSLATLLLLRARADPDRSRGWILWMVFATLAVLSHPFGVTVVVAHLVILLLDGHRTPWREIASLAALPAGIVGAIAVTLLALGPDRLNWIPEAEPARLIEVGYAQAGGGVVRVLPYVLGLVLLLGAVVLAHRSNDRSLARPALIGLCLVLVPLAITTVMSIWQPVLVPRYLIVVLPPLTVLAAAGMAQLPAPAAAVTAAMSVVVCVPGAWSSSDNAVIRQDYRSAVATIVEAGSPDDLVIPIYIGLPAVRYYLDRQLGDESHPATFTDHAFYVHVAADACQFPTIWLVSMDPGAARRMADGLRGTHRLTSTSRFEGLTLRRLDRVDTGDDLSPTGC